MHCEFGFQLVALAFVQQFQKRLCSILKLTFCQFCKDDFHKRLLSESTTRGRRPSRLSSPLVANQSLGVLRMGRLYYRCGVLRVHLCFSISLDTFAYFGGPLRIIVSLQTAHQHETLHANLFVEL